MVAESPEECCNNILAQSGLEKRGVKEIVSEFVLSEAKPRKKRTSKECFEAQDARNNYHRGAPRSIDR